MQKWILVLPLLSSMACADIFKCNENGKVVFADRPCGAAAEKITVVTTPQTSSGSSMASDGIKEMSATLSRDRRIKEVDREIQVLQDNIQTNSANREIELQNLRNKKGYAANNLAGATWEQSISTEMEAVMSKYASKIDMINRQIDRLERERTQLSAP